MTEQTGNLPVDRPSEGFVNAGPFKPPRDMALAREHRIADLDKVVQTHPDTNAVRAAERELADIEARGYRWPFHGGYPVAIGFPYDDAEQQRRIAESG